MNKRTGCILNASVRPWRVEYTTKRGTACIKGADNSIVAVCHIDNAELIVKAVNELSGGVK